MTGRTYRLIDGWSLVEDRYAPEEETSRATVFALSNGYMGLRGAGEELPADVLGAKGCYVGGVYDTPNGKLTEREIVAFPDWTAVRCWVDGDRFDLTTGEILEYCRLLDMRRAIVRRKVRWKSPSGKRVLVVCERFVSRDDVHLGALRIKVEAEDACELKLDIGVEGRVASRWASHLVDVTPFAADGRIGVEAKTTEPGYALRVESRTCWGEHRLSTDLVEDSSAWSSVSCSLREGEMVSGTVFASVVESRFVEGSLADACRERLSKSLSWDGLVAAHERIWADLWHSADVQIEGDEAAQMGIRFSVFHLLAAAPTHSDQVSIPARGLQGQDYYGSIFWDCEIFVFPLFASVLPKIARNLLGYRLATLDGARRKARRFGYQGAFFAWQSQESGDDQCDLYVFDNPFTGEKLRAYFCDEQIHISGDIAHAARQYVAASGDKAFWVEGGAELLTEIARFYVSRAVEGPDGRLHLTSVLGPDEYHERVDDNAYTNWLARASAEWALEALAEMETLDPGAYGSMVERIGLDADEIRSIREFSSRLFVPEPDPKTSLIEQFAGYHGLKHEPVAETRARLAHPDLHPGGELGPYQETQNIKQADVVMLLYLFRHAFEPEVKRANWHHYEPRTAHDSSLSPMAYSLVAADIGMMDWAHKYFLYTSHIDLESYGPHWNLGVHAASLGGAWLSAVHGMAQLSLEPHGLKFRQWPRLPKEWSRLAFRVMWHGTPVVVDVRQHELRLATASNPVPVSTPAGEMTLMPGAPLVLPLGYA